MTDGTHIAVTPWHGDVSYSRKIRSLEGPSGILIITPESLESFLVNRSRSVIQAFGGLKYVIIDELHSFIGNERGKQLQSILARLEMMTHNSPPRIAMSATFSDYSAVMEFLRQDSSRECRVLDSSGGNHQIRILLKEYIPDNGKDIEQEIANELFTKLRGTNNLVFTNSRIAAEKYTVMLGDMSDSLCVPNEFRVHHGSLSKQERNEVEQELQKGNTPVTTMCTSTLELGVDIGKVKSIAQIETANSVSALRQRLGRSGRRGEPSILRIFSIEHPKSSDLSHDLRVNLVQNIAVVELLLQKEYERPQVGKMHMSTLVQQILSLIKSSGGFYAREGWEILCRKGAFRNITSNVFLDLLRSLGRNDVISQLNTGEIIIGKEGERLTQKHDFYTAFISTVGYVVINQADSKPIGEIEYLPLPKQQIILGGRRWIVRSCDDKKRSVLVQAVESGGTIRFSSNLPEIDEIITRKMHEIYSSDKEYAYLETVHASDQELAHARNLFTQNGLDTTSFMNYGVSCLFFTWAGAKVNRTLALAFKLLLNKETDYNYLWLDGVNETDVEALLKCSKPAAEDLAALLERSHKQKQKYDYLLSDALLNLEYASTYLDVDKAWDTLRSH